jgi:hypothetical protein
MVSGLFRNVAIVAGLASHWQSAGMAILAPRLPLVYLMISAADRVFCMTLRLRLRCAQWHERCSCETSASEVPCSTDRGLLTQAIFWRRVLDEWARYASVRQSQVERRSKAGFRQPPRLAPETAAN